MKTLMWIMLASLLATILSMTGCASADKFLGHTEAWYDGKTFYYWSNKNQENLKAALSKDKEGLPVAKIETTASTPESVVAAVAESLKATTEFLNKLLEKIPVPPVVP